MKVYRGTIARGKSRKSTMSAAAASSGFIRFITTVSIAGMLIAAFGGGFFYYMSLVQQIRKTDRMISDTEQQIADTRRALQILSTEYSRLTRYEHIRDKIRAFRLPLTLAHHSQIKSKNMEILTPLQASQIRFPRHTQVAVAENLRRNRNYSNRH